ncbi:hypothetical protein Bca4012_098055 [Brassica carinata]
MVSSRTPFAVSEKEVKAIKSQIEAKLQIPSTPAAIPPLQLPRMPKGLKRLSEISERYRIRLTSKMELQWYKPRQREWVLQVGYWQVDHCAFLVYPWSAEGNLQDHELSSAPTWPVLKNRSIVSILTKVKIEITLEMDPPKLVEVRDVQGNAIRIKVEYPSLPPKRLNCEKYGHLINRCLKPITKRKKESEGSVPQDRMVSTSTKISLKPSPEETVQESGKAVQESEQVISEQSGPSTKKTKKKKHKRGGRSLSRARSESEGVNPGPSVQEVEEHLVHQQLDDKLEGKGESSFDSGLAVQLGELSGLASPKERNVVITKGSSEVGEEGEIEPETPPDADHEEDERLWFKHPKAIRKAIRQEMWNSTFKKQPPKHGFSLRTWGSTSRKKLHL